MGPEARMARNAGIDLLRVISVAAVVVGHGWPLMPYEEYLQIWRMPLFFFLAGFFLSPVRSFAGEIRTRWHTLGVPYLTWLVLLIALVAVHHYTPKPFEDTWLTIAGAVFGGGLTDMPFLAFWFISVMFFAVLLVRLLLTLPWWVQLAAALGGLALAQVPDSAMSYTSLGLGLAPACAAFILAGFWFRRLITPARDAAGAGRSASPAWRQRLAEAARSPWAGVVGVLLIAAGMAGVAAGAETMNMKWSGFGTFLVSPALALLICVGLVGVFSTWADAALKTIPAALTVISELVKTGTMVVFFHAYVLFLIWDLVSYQPLRILIALLVCWSLGLVVNRTRFSPWLTGVPRPRSVSPRTAG